MVIKTEPGLLRLLRRSSLSPLPELRAQQWLVTWGPFNSVYQITARDTALRFITKRTARIQIPVGDLGGKVF